MVGIINQMRSNARLPKSLGRKIQKARISTGLTQEELAEKVQVSRAYMGFIEQGRRIPSLQKLERISKNLGVSLSSLVGT